MHLAAHRFSSIHRRLRKFSLGCACAALALAGSATAQTDGPEKLQCESLANPLGMDTRQPLLSWRLHDSRPGARQSAYQVQVASSENNLVAGKADVWDSGRIESDQTHNVIYAGPTLRPSTRYFWRVLAWDADGKPYPPSQASWWETGLQEQGNWQAKWISYEEPELKQIRESGAAWITNAETDKLEPADTTRHEFRLPIELAQTVRRAALYVAGQDAPAAWVNGEQVLLPQPLPAWRQMPWKTYTIVDVTKQLREGKNILAIETVYYSNGRAPAVAQSPMSAVLYTVLADGSVKLWKTTAQGWRATLNAAGNWQAADFNDASWKAAIALVPSATDFGQADPGNPWPTGPVKALRHNFEMTKKLVAARLYATALGSYEIRINGRAVGDQVLAPGWTDFRQRVIYQTYDVTSLLKSGKNTIAALLAAGWYTTPLQWYRQGYNYGKTPTALRAQLRLEYSDGTTDLILSDENWKAEVSPIVSAEIYDGETYDARRAQGGWDTPSFDDARWKAAEVIYPQEPKIVWQYFPPIRRHQTLQARAVSMPKPGVYIFDFAQNLSGVARFRTQGPAGTDVRLRFAEVLNPDGTLYTDNLRTAKATDHFILSGNGIEEFQPAFTFHGFRYVEVTGAAKTPHLRDLDAIVFHTDAPFTASLKTGSAMLNQLWSNILWGQRSNFVGVPTDCPQRDERLGWSADAQVFWRTASYNMDLATFSRKFGADLRGTQTGTDMYGIFAPGTSSPNPGYGTGWSDAGVIIPWTSWIQTGDKEVVEENWDSMERYLSAIAGSNPDHLWKKNYGIPFADWLAPEGVTPVDLIATAYWAYDVDLMRQMAHAAGKSAEEKKYSELFQQIKSAFIAAYTHPDGFVGGVPPPPVFASGTERKLSDTPVETQTGYVLALHMNLLPDAARPLAAERLVKRLEANQWRLGTGFLGTPYLLSALTDTGHADVAYRLLLNTEYPSWGYLVNHGATTMWERWNGDQMREDPSMNSYNHYAYGAVADWIYRYAAGIDTVETDPGFHTIHLHPNFDARLGSLDFSYDSTYGTIASSWTVSGKNAVWKLTIPPNAKGELPRALAQKQMFRLAGKPLADNANIHASKNRDNQEVFELPSGTYEFEMAVP